MFRRYEHDQKDIAYNWAIDCPQMLLAIGCKSSAVQAGCATPNAPWSQDITAVSTKDFGPYMARDERSVLHHWQRS